MKEIPIGAVVSFFLSPAEIQKLRPEWIPADGRILDDSKSDFHQMKLPDLRGRVAVGIADETDVTAAEGMEGGSTKCVARTSPVENAGRLVGFEQSVRHEGFPPKFVIDVAHAQEYKVADHLHDVEIPDIRPPFRKLAYLIRVR